jgi:tetratricopeptide (TPR) repeat protein
MKTRFAVLASVLLLSGANGVYAAGAPKAPAPYHPWDKDTKTINATISDVHKTGMSAVGAHVADLEKALAGAKHSFEVAAAGEGTKVYQLIDDTDDAIVPPNTKDKNGKLIVTAINPYLEIGFFLGSYYDQIGKPADALRVLDASLALPGSDKNSHASDLQAERGAALGSLKRWDESLAAYDTALKDGDPPPSVHAYLDRGRGMALFELGRKEEAKNAYLDALRLVSNDPVAKKELEYIEQSQDGGEKLPPSVKAFQVPADAKPSDTKPADAKPAEQSAPPKP